MKPKLGPMPIDEAVQVMDDYARHLRGELYMMPTNCTKARKLRAIEALKEAVTKGGDDAPDCCLSVLCPPGYYGLVRDEAGHVWRIHHGAEVPHGFTLLADVCDAHGMLKNTTAWGFNQFHYYLNRTEECGRVMSQREIDALSREYQS